MKVAIPVWEKRISPVFDTTTHILIAEINGRKLSKKEKMSLESLSVFQRIDLLEKLGVEVFICGGITRPILDSIRSKNIQTFAYVCGDAETVLKAFCDGKDIKALFSMPGDLKKEKG
ncbi:MAG: hypothetical protein H6696_01565 [Deferribacteres bacterium]|nr:hypothetical protein [candidate division KSB1 bacterium]MCB9500598.1 hypothetical protein [Deferribacteres bacterium]